MDHILHTLLSEYEQLRRQAQRQAQQREEELVNAHPTLQEIQKKRRQILLAAPREQLSPDPEAAKQARHQALLQLEQEQAAFVRSLGLTEDYLAPQYRCAACEDTGYVGQSPRRMCSCLLQRRAERALGSAGLPAHERFECFRTDIYPSEEQRRRMEKVRDIALAYAQSFPHNEKKDLLLLGGPGLGKTFLVNAIGARVIQRGFEVKKVTAYAMIQDILAGFGEDRNAAAAYQQTPLLLLDDLGSEAMIPNVTLEYVFSILNERRAAGLPTVCASNLSPAQIGERYGERILSRLFSREEVTLLNVTGENLRLYGQRKD